MNRRPPREAPTTFSAALAKELGLDHAPSGALVKVQPVSKRRPPKQRKPKPSVVVHAPPRFRRIGG